VEVIRTRQTHTPKIIIEGWAERKAAEYNRQEDLLLEVADATDVWIGEEFLNKIVEEIADNAFKFSELGTPVQIAAGVNADRYTLQISDRGRGMTTQQIAEIGAYMQFERKVYEQQGSGLGLIIARRLAELHGGDLTVDSAYGEWTTVTLVLGRGARSPQA
jgi:two-component system sensor histidine kinase/response regulator